MCNSTVLVNLYKTFSLIYLSTLKMVNLFFFEFSIALLTNMYLYAMYK